MLYRGIIIFLLFILSPVFLWGNIDSLIKLYDLTNDPYQEGRIALTIAKSYAGKGWRLKNGQDTVEMESALIWAERSNKSSLYSDHDSLKIVTYKAVGAINLKLENYDIALVYQKKGLKISKENNDTTNIADISNNIANTFYRKGDFPTALVWYYDAISEYEKLNYIKQTFRLNNSLGIMFQNRKLWSKSLIHLKKAAQEIQLLYGRGLSNIYKEHEPEILMNIGIAYLKLDSLDLALNFQNKTIDLSKDTDPKQYGRGLNNIGEIYLKKEDYVLAKSNFKSSLTICKEINDIKTIADNNLGLAKIHQAKNEPKRSIELCNIIIKNNYYTDKENLIKVYDVLHKSYEASGNLSKSLYYLKKFNKTEKIINSIDNERKTLTAQIGYVFNKKLDENEKEKLLNEQRLERQQLYNYIIMLVAVLIAILAIMIGLNLRKEKKTKRHIITLNDQLSSKNKSILDSINYAKKIQNSIMPPEEVLSKSFKDAFVYFKPKDIVSGDFYWMKQWKDSILVAVVDCTGHGVPGAFMSLLGFESINQALVDLGEVNTSNLLDELNNNIKKSVGSYNEKDAIKDGMDVGLCQYFPKTKKLLFSGANNPCYIIRNKEVTELKGDIFPIGHYHEKTDDMKFAQKEYQLQENDSVYIFSDGYPDQFGGPRGKKLKYRAFKALLNKVSEKSMAEQKEALLSHMADWMGKEEQIDDMCIIGFRA